MSRQEEASHRGVKRETNSFAAASLVALAPYSSGHTVTAIGGGSQSGAERRATD